MSQRELGTIMDVDPSVLVTLLNPLEAHDQVSRRRDATDGRRHIVTLTGSGARHLIAAARAQRDAEDALLAGLTADQREQLRELLLTLRDTLDPTEGADCEAAQDSCQP
jgi:MarR family transcriptional regulator, lower aerobic nicotinate degradation pathway regulator